MTAFNIVRFRVKPGHQDHFIAAHRAAIKKPPFKGFRGGALVKTGDETFCIIGEWTNFKAIENARPTMIGILDTFREHLEELGGALGVTDPVSGEMVLKLPPTTPAKKSTKKKTAKKRR